MESTIALAVFRGTKLKSQEAVPPFCLYKGSLADAPKPFAHSSSSESKRLIYATGGSLISFLLEPDGVFVPKKSSI